MDDTGGLQLNIISSKVSNNTVKKSKKQKEKTKESIQIDVVKKPVLEGKTFAKKRPLNKISNEDGKPKFSFLNENKSNDEETSPKKIKTNNHEQKNEGGKKEFKEKFKKNKRNDANTEEKVKEKSIFAKVSGLFRNNPEIPVIGQRHVKPINEKVFSGKDFSDLNIHSHQIANLEKNLGLKQLTVVQQKATPVILQGRDVLVRSQTGSGKTLAYALPIVEALQAIRPKLKRQDGVKALVIVPTRELALQTYELFVKLVYPFTWLVPGYLIGGEKRKAEKNRIKKGINILIGTPGRICDHLQLTQSLRLNDARCFVLDEADRLFDMGYEKDVASIVEALEQHKINASYDPMAIMKETIKGTHVKFNDDDDENEEIGKPQEEVEEKEEKTKTDEEIKYEHELTNVFLSEKRSTVLLSATLTKAVQTLAGLTMMDPVFIDASEGRALIADSLPVPKTEPVKIEEKFEDDLEIVALEKSDDESGDADTEDTDNEDDEEVEEKKNLPVYKGLQQFKGTKSLIPKPPKLAKSAIIKDVFKDFGCKDEDDSDSDYDFFAALKEESKSATVVKTEIVTESGNFENAFQNAVQNAIIQDEMVVPSSVNQIYIVAPMKLRLVTLCSIIIDRCVKPGSGKIIVFMATQDMIDYHCELLSRVLSGKKPISFNTMREDTFKKIKEKKLKKRNKIKDEESEEDQIKSEEETQSPKKKENNTKDEESDKDQIKSEEETQSPKKKSKKKNKRKDEESDEEEETKAEEPYKDDYDGMTLAQWEDKARVDAAFVNVEFFQLHGSMDQRTRTQVFKTFRKANSGVLLCTDVAARGLDLPHVDCIIQYTGPISATDYVHRVGRTARAGNVGTAIMLLLPSEVLFVRQLEERRIRLHQEDMENHLSALVEIKGNREYKKMQKGGPAPEQTAATELQYSCEELVEADEELRLKGCKAFTSWMRFYSTYPREARAAFDRKALHVGHAARSLALRQTPKEIVKSVPQQESSKPKKQTDFKKKKEAEDPDAPKVQKPKLSVKAAHRERKQVIDEFDSGLEPVKKKKKKAKD